MIDTAERRMFAKTIIDSDAFLEMPVSARLLYYDLAMRADDDGFVNSPKKIMRMIGASPDDLNILSLRKFIIPFDNGVVVIKHWKIHNYIQNDRYKETTYKQQKAMLELDENKAYRLPESYPEVPCIQNGYNMDTQVRLGKDSIELGKDSIGECMDADKPPRTRFTPPTVQEVKAYCIEKEYHVDAERFVDYYTSNGWMVGRTHMKDWKAAVRTWAKKDSKENKKTNNIFLQILEDEHGQNTNNFNPFGS